MFMEYCRYQRNLSFSCKSRSYLHPISILELVSRLTKGNVRPHPELYFSPKPRSLLLASSHNYALRFSHLRVLGWQLFSNRVFYSHSGNQRVFHIDFTQTKSQQISFLFFMKFPLFQDTFITKQYHHYESLKSASMFRSNHQFYSMKGLRTQIESSREFIESQLQRIFHATEKT